MEQVVTTSHGARTMDVDTATGLIYLPTADTLPPAPGADARQATMKPDSFKLVVVGRAK